MGPGPYEYNDKHGLIRRGASLDLSNKARTQDSRPSYISTTCLMFVLHSLAKRTESYRRRISRVIERPCVQTLPRSWMWLNVPV